MPKRPFSSKNHTPNPTIAAIATAPGAGGVGVVRISGPHALSILEDITSLKPQARHAHFTHFLDSQGQTLDEGLALYFPAPHSFTGEEVVELQGHGGQAVLKLLLSRCIELGARLAEPGEFTRRAFLNGKLDLAQAEAVADLIAAHSSSAARAAVRSLSGTFSQAITTIQSQLTELRVLIEATLDFPEEEIDILESAQVSTRLTHLKENLLNIQDKATQGALLRRGLNVVLVGAPNVGKSSLLNQLAGQERAIVTDIAGTTRDTISEAIQIEGIPLHIIDTAGLRNTEDTVERIGISRTWQALESADVIVFITAPDADPLPEEIVERLPSALPRIHVHNKIDLSATPPQSQTLGANERHVHLSTRNGEGMDLMRQALLQIAGWHSHAEDIFLARERHLQALKAALAHIRQAQSAGLALEFLAEELRLAQQQLGQITGEFTSDDLLGKIFSDFCIGK